MLKARVPLLLDLPEQAWFDLALMAKDIRLAREAADVGCHCSVATRAGPTMTFCSRRTASK
jgi:hypothetical protein